MYGHPRRPMRRKGGARLLARRIEAALAEAREGKALRLAAAVGRARGQRVLLHGEPLRHLALGGERLPAQLTLAVGGDALGYARELADRARGRWWPRWSGPAAAEVQLGPLRLVVSVLSGGILPFLSRARFTFDALGQDLTEPDGVLDAWGGLDDAAARRLVVTGPTAPTTEVLLEGVLLAREHGLDRGARLRAGAARLTHAEALLEVPRSRFWELLSPALAPGRAGWFRDGELSGILDAALRHAGAPGPRFPDASLLASLDSLEAGLVARQIRERGVPPGVGLSGSARLLGLYALRRPGPSDLTGRWFEDVGLAGPYGFDALQEALGAPFGVTRTLVSLARAAAALEEAGFPRRVEHRRDADVVTAAAALLVAGLDGLAGTRGDVAVLRRSPVRSLVGLLGLRVPRRAA